MVRGNTNDDERYRNFYSVLKEKLQHYRDAKRHLDRFLSTDFNVFKVIRPKEPHLSEIIADLLDPDGSHGQCRGFLDAFLRQIIKQPIDLDGLLNQSPLSVTCESQTVYIEKSQRRLDILVAYENFGLAIENKPWAPDQKEQLQDYIRNLREKFKDKFCLIYLTLEKKNPSENSIKPSLREDLKKKGKLICASYRDDILKWLEECCQLCESDKFRWFLRDFVDYIPTMEEQMSNSSERKISERKMIVAHALENKENLKMALDVGSVYDDLRKQLITGFSTQLKECLESHLDMTEWKCIDDGAVENPLGPPNNNSLGFAKESWNGEYGIGIQPEKQGTIICGVYCGEQNSGGFPIKDLEERLLKRTGKMGSSDTYWIWRHTLNNDDLLIKMYTGEAVTEFAELIKEIIEVAAPVIDKHVK